MNAWTKLSLLAHMMRWRLTWNRRDTRKAYPVKENPKFMSARDAVRLIPDDAVVAFSGLGGNQRASIIYWAMRELFEETGHPHGLTGVAAGGIGGRGRVPGTVEELGLDGLMTRFFSGHLETFKSILKLSTEGRLELQCLPQGIIIQLMDAQGRGEDSIVTNTGTGTFIDPRVGRGTPVEDETAEQWVEALPDGQLRYRIPKITVAVFNIPAADREGNLYAKNSAMLAESQQIARAAKRNGGIVIANVGLVVDKGYDEVFIPSDLVDAVVVFSKTEQVGAVSHRRYWPLFTTHSNLSPEEGSAQLRFVNQVLGITPRRSEADNALARLGAKVFTENSHKNAFVNIGVGLPEEICRAMAEAGIMHDITLFSESGVIGGLPAPGVFFGAGICPKEMVPSVEIFRRAYASLDVTILGVLQADSQGNVNVSKRGEGALNYVGPGGFIDFTTAARTVCFVSSWMAHGKIKVEGDRMRILEYGKPKFVASVDEVTFSGPEALKAGKRVFYVTHAGVFRLTERGMELISVMPGIDVRRDILDFAPMRVVMPESGHVPVVDASVVSGKNFALTLPDQA